LNVSLFHFIFGSDSSKLDNGRRKNTVTFENGSKIIKILGLVAQSGPERWPHLISACIRKGYSESFQIQGTLLHGDPEPSFLKERRCRDLTEGTLRGEEKVQRGIEKCLKLKPLVAGSNPAGSTIFL